MIKAYLKDCVITIVDNGKEKLKFVAGSALLTIGEKNAEKNPYTFFEDYDEFTLKKLVHAELNKLYELGNVKPGVIIDALDGNRADKLYTNRKFEVSFETVLGELVFVVYPNSVYDMLAFELLCAVSRGKPLKKCEHCGGFFFPNGRSDAVYCNRVGKDGFSCKQIGANRQYRQNSRADSVKKLYDKITKHNRYLKNRGLVSEEIFSRWMSEAASMLAQFKQGSISETTLTNWLSDASTLENQPARRNEISDYLL